MLTIAEIFVLSVLSLLAPAAKLVAYNSRDFSLGILEILVTCMVGGLMLTFAISALALFRVPRRILGTASALLLIFSVVFTFLIPAHLAVLDGESSVEVQTRSDARIGLWVACASLVLLIWANRFAPRLYGKIDQAVRTARVFAVLYTVLFFGYASTVPQQLWLSGFAPATQPAPLSQESNVFLISFDQTQGSLVHGLLSSDPELAQNLDGFRFFSDAASTYPNTDYSLSSVLMGRIARVAAENTVSSRASAESIFARAAESGVSVFFNKHFFTNLGQCITCGVPAFNTILSYTLLRHSFNLAFGVDIKRLGILPPARLIAPVPPDIISHAWQIDLNQLSRLTERLTINSPQPTLYMAHFLGTHQPFIYSPDCTVITEQEVSANQSPRGAINNARCALKLIAGLIAKLKALNVYDQSTILLYGDHGYEANINKYAASPDFSEYFTDTSALLGSPDNIKPAGAYNPMLLFKPAHARGKLVFDQSPVSLIDVTATACAALGCKDAWEGLDLHRKIPAKRLREFWLYKGGADRRADDGSDKFHYGLNRFWQRASFEGPLNPNLAVAMGAHVGPTVYEIGNVVKFGSGGNAQDYSLTGWGEAEGDLRWIEGGQGRLKMAIEKPGKKALTLKMNLLPLLSPSIPNQTVRVLINKHEIAQWRVDRAGWYKAQIESGLADNGQVGIALEVSNPISPCEFSNSADCRKLGVAASSLMITR